jgi:hypothetical protein
MDDFNPYAAPNVPLFEIDGEGEGEEGVWRDDKTLIMRKDALLPPRCLKCNEPTKLQLKRNLSWHPQLVYLVVLLNLIIYVIIALIVRKTAKVAYPLCAAHLSRRRKAIAIGWLVSLLGIATMIVGGAAMSDNPAPAFVAGAVLLLGGIFGGVLGAQTVQLKKIDKLFVYLGKVDPAYLDALPELPKYMMVRTEKLR